MYSDAEAAVLYDLLNPWDPEGWPGDAFYARLAHRAGAVLDVGCGTGAMLHRLRADGHTGRLVGLDPDGAALARARRRADVEWVAGTAATADRWDGEFDLAVMTGHAFQFLRTDEEIRASLAAVRAALRPGGRFAFETRHPAARAWEQWNPSNAAEVTDAAGRALRVWHEVESVADGLVTFLGRIADARDGALLRTDRERLRFLAEPELDALLAEAGLAVAARHGDWTGGPVGPASREIVTVAVAAPGD
ncbi:class I SAM-dependent methyltransferase [Kitasatospora sp. NPDC088391]|uniref:class I SAM-dependent methyltransferase n=1 Tax=Kitasatospora sp. NPDC088391 TaxID=3364074 RepID=UPI0037F16D2D